MRAPRVVAALAASAMSAVIAAPAAAQIESALLSKITFNLANPGGKSLAMGGAFTAIADDSTAAIANPAGLGLLSSFEAGVSGKRRDDVIGLNTARATATGGLVDPYPDVRSVNSDLSQTGSAFEYAGVVIPVSSRLVAALTYSENLRFRGDPGPDGYQYVELRDNRSGGPFTRRDFLYEYREFGAASLSNRLLGLSAAFRVTEALRVGAGLTLNRTTFELLGDAGGPHRIVNTSFRTPTDVDVQTTYMRIEDFGGTVPGIVLGVHADLLPEGKLTAGASFRASGKSHGTLVIGGVPSLPDGLVGQESRRFSFSVPKDASAGLAFQPFPGMTIAAEGQWVSYGDIADVSLPVVSYNGFLSTGYPMEGALAEMRRPRNVVIPRIGFEYVAVQERARVAFRVGYHREPAHGVSADLRFTDAAGTYDMTDPPFSQAVRTVFDGGRPDDRFSGGLGLTIGRVSLDLAFDLGRASRQLATSVFYRF